MDKHGCLEAFLRPVDGTNFLPKLDIVTLFSNMGLVLSACASGIAARTQEQSR